MLNKKASKNCCSFFDGIIDRFLLHPKVNGWRWRVRVGLHISKGNGRFIRHVLLEEQRGLWTIRVRISSSRAAFHYYQGMATYTTSLQKCIVLHSCSVCLGTKSICTLLTTTRVPWDYKSEVQACKPSERLRRLYGIFEGN